MQAFANTEMNFDFLLTSNSLVSLTFVLLANAVILNNCERALPINLNLLHKLAKNFEVVMHASIQKIYI